MTDPIKSDAILNGQNYLTTIRYEQILSELDAMAEWLPSKAQIRIDGTRFSEIRACVQEIVIRLQNGTLEELVAAKGNELLWNALTESDSFIRIYSALKQISSQKLPRGSLKKCLSGPLLPREESHISAESRNTVFELELAARFHEVGIELTGFDDIDMLLDMSQVGVECKRPFSAKSSIENLRKAKEQIRKKHGPFKLGMIAFAIDKICQTDRKILVVNNKSEVPGMIYPYINKFLEENRGAWRGLLNTKIVGIIVCLKYVCHIRDLDLLTTGFEIAIYDRRVSPEASRLIEHMKKQFAIKYRAHIY